GVITFHSEVHDRTASVERLFARRMPRHIEQRAKLLPRRFLSLNGLEKPVPHPGDRKFESLQGKCFSAFEVSIKPTLLQSGDPHDLRYRRTAVAPRIK